jgi:hypothetical protein
MLRSAPPFGSACGVNDTEASRALHAAARLVIEEAFMDLVELGTAPMGRAPFLVSTIYLPRRYRDRYDMEFVKRWVVALSVVSFKLAQPAREPLACVAERLALHTVIRMATDRALERREEIPEFGGLWKALGGEVLSLLEPVCVTNDLEFEQWFTGADGTFPAPLHPFYPRAGE